MADGGHGPQTSAGREVVVTTHWSGASNDGVGGDQGIYCLPPELGRTIHFDPSYHRLVFHDGADAGNAPIQEMMGTAHPGYHGDKGREGIRGGEVGEGGGGGGG